MADMDNLMTDLMSALDANRTAAKVVGSIGCNLIADSSMKKEQVEQGDTLVTAAGTVLSSNVLILALVEQMQKATKEEIAIARGELAEIRASLAKIQRAFNN